jgi:hypothetical protein
LEQQCNCNSEHSTCGRLHTEQYIGHFMSIAQMMNTMWTCSGFYAWQSAISNLQSAICNLRSAFCKTTYQVKFFVPVHVRVPEQRSKRRAPPTMPSHTDGDRIFNKCSTTFCAPTRFFQPVDRR